MTPTQRLRLYEIADLLDRYEIDNGPMGSYSPFREEARELREIARHVNGSRREASDKESGDFRDGNFEAQR